METIARLLDIGPVPVNFVDQIVSVDVIGPNIRIVLGERRRMEGELVCVPVIEIVRPLISEIPAAFERMLARALSGANPGIGLVLH